MANFLSKLVKWYGPDRVGASGSFTTAGAGTITTSDLFGIVSIARTGVGVFLVTLMDTAKEYNVQVTRQCAAALAVNQAVVSAMSLTSRTVTITVTDAAGAAADTTALTLHLQVLMRRGN